MTFQKGDIVIVKDINPRIKKSLIGKRMIVMDYHVTCNHYTCKGYDGKEYLFFENEIEKFN